MFLNQYHKIIKNKIKLKYPKIVNLKVLQILK